jgi:hypothetical protein
MELRNESMKTNRRWLNPLNALRELQCGRNAPALLSAAVAYLLRSPKDTENWLLALAVRVC